MFTYKNCKKIVFFEPLRDFIISFPVGNYWMTEEGTTNQGFVLNAGCVTTFTKFYVKNTRNHYFNDRLVFSENEMSSCPQLHIIMLMLYFSRTRVLYRLTVNEQIMTQ